jgi:hypothetical protein
VLAEVATNADLYQHIMPFRRQLKRQLVEFIQAYCIAQQFSVTEGEITLMVDTLFHLFNGAICSAALSENVDSNHITQLSRQLVTSTLGLKTTRI